VLSFPSSLMIREILCSLGAVILNSVSARIVGTIVSNSRTVSNKLIFLYLIF